MKKAYQAKRAGVSAPVDVVASEAATIALAEIVGAAKGGLLALAVGAGMQVLMAESVTALCGPRDKHNPDRVGHRHGSEAGSVTLGGRRVPVVRPRVRAASCRWAPTSCLRAPSCSG